MKLLEDNNIIYIKHSDSAKRDSNGQIKNLSNCYGRLGDKEKINSFYAKRRKEQGGFDFTIDRIESSKKAQIKKDYNAFKNKKYKGDVVELCARVIAYNQDYYTVQNEQQKDLSIFDEEIIAKAKELSVKETVNNLNEQEEKTVAYTGKNIPYEEVKRKEDTSVDEVPVQEDKVVVITKRFSEHHKEDNIQPMQELNYEERRKKEMILMESLVEKAWNRQQKGEKVGDYLLATLNDFLRIMGENYFINKQSKEIEASLF